MIKTNSGKIYELQGPNIILKNQGKYWKNEDIKYINFDNYGKNKILYNTKEITKKEEIININIPKIENIYKEKQTYIEPVLNKQEKNKYFEEDKYLEELTNQKLNETIEKINQEQQEELKINNDIILESAGSTVCIINEIGQVKYKKYAVVIEDRDKNRTLLIKDYKYKNNESVICEWDNTKWKIKKSNQQNNNSIVDLINP
jgi:hypothetical protein